MLWMLPASQPPARSVQSFHTLFRRLRLRVLAPTVSKARGPFPLAITPGNDLPAQEAWAFFLLASLAHARYTTWPA